MNKETVDLYQDLLDEDETAEKLNKHKRTLKVWRDKGIGPPITYIGRFPFYRLSSLIQWIAEQERQPGKPEPERRRPGRPRRL
jgi:hypothetical protein